MTPGWNTGHKGAVPCVQEIQTSPVTSAKALPPTEGALSSMPETLVFPA